jgi:hypothetical protein
LPVVTSNTVLESESPTIPPEQKVQTEYTAALDINVKERKILGVEKIQCMNSTDATFSEIYMNVFLNAFSAYSPQNPVSQEASRKVYRYGEDYGYMTIGEVFANSEEAEYELNDTVLKIILPQELRPGENVEIKLDFEGYIPMINARTGSNGIDMWCGNLLPTLAVYDKNGWHTDPYYSLGDPFYTRSANFSVSITTPIEYVVVGTGTSTYSERLEKKTTTFAAKLVRDFAFAISSRYKSKSITTSTGVDIDLYTFSEPRNYDEILSVAEKSMDYFGEMVGAYPYPQLVLVEAGLPYYNGMEYPEVIFLDSDFLNEASDYTPVAHEIGHQWFYNIIGSNQISNAWMDEGMTMFMQEGIFKSDAEIDETARAEYEALKESIEEISPSWLDASLAVYSRWSDYYNVQYMRGKLMFYALKKKIGEEKFNAFIKDYYQKYSFKIASPQDLMETAENAAGLSLEGFFGEWMSSQALPPL